MYSNKVKRSLTSRINHQQKLTSTTVTKIDVAVSQKTKYFLLNIVSAKPLQIIQRKNNNVRCSSASVPINQKNHHLDGIPFHEQFLHIRTF